MKDVGSINHESLQTIRRNNIEKVSQINWAKNYLSWIAVVRKCGGKWAREPPFVSRGQNPSSLAAAEPSATGAVAAARRTSHSSRQRRILASESLVAARPLKCILRSEPQSWIEQQIIYDVKSDFFRDVVQ